MDNDKLATNSPSQIRSNVQKGFGHGRSTQFITREGRFNAIRLLSNWPAKREKLVSFKHKSYFSSMAMFHVPTGTSIKFIQTNSTLTKFLQIHPFCSVWRIR